jgi:hypothetical protein
MPVCESFYSYLYLQDLKDLALLVQDKQDIVFPKNYSLSNSSNLAHPARAKRVSFISCNCVPVPEFTIYFYILFCEALDKGANAFRLS